MKIISLDLSTKSTGYAIFNDTELAGYGELKAASADVIARIYKIIDQLKEIIKDNLDIQKVIIEEVRPEDKTSNAKNIHTQKVLMWLQAALVFMIHDFCPKASIEYVYPSSWRTKCGIRTGRGIKRNELKMLDIEFVKEKYNITVNDDAADAIGIGHAYINNLSDEFDWS